jgi:quercetin dioxygenase-like cupin family protein/peroxiredoxin
MRAPVPEDSEPKISAFSITGPPAPPVQSPIGAGHTHAGPVFVYILQGEIETQVEPDAPRIYQPVQFFYEAPMHVHRFQRNLSKTEPGRVTVFQQGNTGQAAAVKLLLQEPLLYTTNQEASLLRLTPPPGAAAQARTHSGPGFVFVREGKIETGSANQTKIYSAGDLCPEPANVSGPTYRNASGGEPAKLLLYQVSEKQAASKTETGEQICDAARKVANLDFTIADITGKNLTLSAYSGKVILLDFWATWCPPCLKEIPGFIDLYNRYKSRGFVVLGVSVDESPADVKKFVQNLRVNYPILLGGARDGLQQAFGPTGFPTAFTIGRNGRICAQHTGLTPLTEIERMIKPLL